MVPCSHAHDPERYTCLQAGQQAVQGAVDARQQGRCRLSTTTCQSQRRPAARGVGAPAIQAVATKRRPGCVPLLLVTACLLVICVCQQAQ